MPVYQRSLNSRVTNTDLVTSVVACLMFLGAVFFFGTGKSTEAQSTSRKYNAPFVIRWNGIDGGIIVTNTGDQPITVLKIKYYDGLYPDKDKEIAPNEVVEPKRHTAYNHSQYVESGFGQADIAISVGNSSVVVQYTVGMMGGCMPQVLTAKEVTSR